MQWHPTILTRLALVPQRVMNAYHQIPPGQKGGDVYQDDDFLVRFVGCEVDASRSCEKEMEGYYKKWKEAWRKS